ncbi:MAG: hypothetical protein IT440_14865 [Phycisphaeraceae bacterium]|nr:hypothetical protein [Phycisphaeraceae bacterium]
MNPQRAALLSMRESHLVVAQVDSLGVNGVALARGENAIGFRAVPLLPGTGRFDGKMVINTLTEIGPHDPADQYHHLSFKTPITQQEAYRFLRLELFTTNSMVTHTFAPDQAATIHLEWTRDDVTAYAKISSDLPVDVMLLLNGCVKPASVKSVSASSASLEQNGWTVHAAIGGDVKGHGRETQLDRLETLLRGLKPVQVADEVRVTGHRLSLSANQPVYVVLSETPMKVDGRRIDAMLEAGKAAMAGRLMSSAGAAAHCADAVQRIVGYCSAYDPASGLRHLPVNRDWVPANHLPVECLWDIFFDTYLGSLHNPEVAKESLRQILYTIESRGVIGAPPQRNLIQAVMYSKMVRFMGDRDFAALTLPTIMTFLRFFFGDRGDGHPWRDGNDDGLIECGSCHKPGEASLDRIIQNSFDETGYDDSPMYSAGFSYEWRGLLAKDVQYDFDRGTLNLTMVGQNAMYVAACRSVAVVARWVDDEESQSWLLAEAQRVAGRIKERLFDKSVGYYQNRFFDGHFSSVKTPDIFFPLLTGIGDGQAVQRLREILLDPRQFWGDNVVPTVSRDDPGYCDDPIRSSYWQGNYWRGNPWPPTNYITYLAAHHAGWHDVASELSDKSVRMFMDDWLTRCHFHENYPPVGGNTTTQMFAGFGGRDPHYVWAGLMPVMALEQLFAVEDTVEGLRFGTVQERSFGSWEGFVYHSRRGVVRCDAKGLSLDIPSLLRITCDKPVAVRQFTASGGEVRFHYTAINSATLNITCEGRSATVMLSPNQDGQACGKFN